MATCGYMGKGGKCTLPAGHGGPHLGGKVKAAQGKPGPNLRRVRREQKKKP